MINGDANLSPRDSRPLWPASNLEFDRSEAPSVRHIAEEFGRHFDVGCFEFEESPTALF
jgi:hypothetical protein